jgi:hypothetical protein
VNAWPIPTDPLMDLPQDEQIKAIIGILGYLGGQIADIGGTCEAHTAVLAKILAEVRRPQSPTVPAG